MKMNQPLLFIITSLFFFHKFIYLRQNTMKMSELLNLYIES